MEIGFRVYIATTTTTAAAAAAAVNGSATIKASSNTNTAAGPRGTRGVLATVATANEAAGAFEMTGVVVAEHHFLDDVDGA
jgi:hypothetical protein